MLQKGHLLSSLCAMLIRVVLRQRDGKHASFPGPKCNQLMRFQSLAPMLAHTDARSHLADVWSGETRDPFKVG